MKPVLLNPDLFKLLPPELQDMQCGICNNQTAKWAYWDRKANPDGEPEPYCSFCAMYETNWGKSARADLDGIADEIEKAEDVKFIRNNLGSVTTIADCDRVMMSIYITNRMVMMSNKIAKEQKQQTKERKTESGLILLS